MKKKLLVILALLLLAAAGAWAQNIIDLATVTRHTTVPDGYTLTGTLDVENYPVKISIADGATVTLDGVTIIGVSNNSYEWGGINCEGNVTLILVGTNTLSGFDEHYPGIYVPQNSTLTIQGTGSLTASGKSDGAGIGGGNRTNCGNIVIAGGNITATGGGVSAPGIGAGYRASCGAISISGGTVTATGNLYGPAIGAGYEASCGAISISGGTVTAKGGNYAAGIGAGYYNASCVSIDITGGIVTATGGTNAAGIGTGQESSCGPITITDGVTQVTSIKGSSNVQSIGKGDYGICGTVTIGSVVYWNGSAYQNGGDNAQTGIVKSPYYYPIRDYILTDIPSGWSITVNNQPVTPNNGKASIPVGAEVVLTPTAADKPRVKSVTLTDPLTIPLTFEAKTAGAQVTFSINATAAPNGVEYSTDGSTWKIYKSDSAIVLTNIGDKVSFRGDNVTYATSPIYASNFSCSDSCYIYGNVMSLINSTSFATNLEFPTSSTYSFTGMFHGNAKLNNHPSIPLLLPATTMKYFCYTEMFMGCSSLTSAPALPATTLAPSCYEYMFKGCTGLTTAPALPAETLAEYCYSAMFLNCTNLTTAPALDATTLTTGCYQKMFSGCTLLNQVTCLATSGINSNNSTTNWLYGVASSGTFIKPSSAGLNSGEYGTYWTTGSESGIPTGWTVGNN